MLERFLSSKTSPWRDKKLPDGALEILTVHPGSVAASAGLRPGMIYVAEQAGTAVREWNQIRARGETGTVRSQFIDPGARTVTVIESQGFPWGMQLERPIGRVCEDLRGLQIMPSVWVVRALEGSDATFDGMSAAAFAGCTRPVIPGLPMLMRRSRVPTLSAPKLHQKVILVAAAIAAARRGHVALARKLIPSLSELQGTETSIGALTLYGEAMVLKAEGKPQEVVRERLEFAFQLYPKSKRIADALTAEGGPLEAAPQVPPETRFPSKYTLPAVDALDGPIDLRRAAASEAVSLAQNLTALGPDQLGVVIMMGGYRVNGPYAHQIGNLAMLHATLGPHLPFIHVISSAVAVDDGVRIMRPDFVNTWRFGEDSARARKIPLTVLYDEDDRLLSHLDVQGTPTMFLLDRSGYILYRGSASDDGPFWTALERLSQK